jgi:YHS domain-containing protein
MNNFFVKHKSGLSTLILGIIGRYFCISKMQTSFQKSPSKIKVIADAGQQPVDKMMVTVTSH